MVYHGLIEVDLGVLELSSIFSILSLAAIAPREANVRRDDLECALTLDDRLRFQVFAIWAFLWGLLFLGFFILVSIVLDHSEDFPNDTLQQCQKDELYHDMERNKVTHRLSQASITLRVVKHDFAPPSVKLIITRCSALSGRGATRRPQKSWIQHTHAR
jgi:hypothetical protein